MKKRLIAMLLVTAMVLSSAVTVVAADQVETTEFKMSVTGNDNPTAYTSPSEGLSTQGLTLDFALMGKNMAKGMAQIILLALDTDVVRLVSQQGEAAPDGAVVKDAIINALPEPSGLGDEWITNLHGPTEYKFNKTMGAYTWKPRNIEYVRLTMVPDVTYNDAFWTQAKRDAYTGAGYKIIRDELVPIARVYLAFVNGKTKADLDSGSIRVVTQSELVDFQGGYTGAASMLGLSNAEKYNYRTVSISGGVTSIPTANQDNLPAPQISYPNNDKTGLNSVKLEMMKKSVNTPTVLPVSGDVTVGKKAVTAYDGTNCEGNVLSSGVTYTYSLQFKAKGADASVKPADLTEAQAALISVDNNGTVTIKSGAPAGTLYVTANGTYTAADNGGKVTTAKGTAELVLSHGDATKEAPKDTPAGEKDPDVTKELKGVKVEVDGTTVIAADSLDRNYEYGVLYGGAVSGDQDFIMVAHELDQYGDDMATKTGSWTQPADMSHVEYDGANDKVTIKDTIPNNTSKAFTYTTTGTVITSTVTFKISDTVIHWPVLTKSNLTYGEQLKALGVLTGSASNSSGAIADVSFQWADGEDHYPNADAVSQSATMKYYVGGAEQTGVTKVYNFHVNKATPVIQVAGDKTDLTVGKIWVEVGGYKEHVLGAKVLNPITKTEVTTINPSSPLTVGWNITGTNAGSFIQNNTTGNIKAKDTDPKANVGDTGKLTLTINGVDNNYETISDREIDLQVSKQFLDPDIEIAYENGTEPVYGQKITFTITPKSYQKKSLTSDVTWEVGWWDAATSTFTAKSRSGNPVAGNLVTNTAPNEEDPQTVIYTTDDKDVGKTLVLQLHAPASSATYDYINNVQSEATLEVKGAPQPAPKALKYTATKNSITITEVTLNDGDGLEGGTPDTVITIPDGGIVRTASADKDGTNLYFAIREKNGTAPDPATASDWQESHVFNTGIAVNTEYDVYVINAAGQGYAVSTAYKETVKSGKIIIQGDDTTDPPIDEKYQETTPATLTVTGKAKYNETLTAEITDALVKENTAGEGETANWVEISDDLYTYIRWETKSGKLLKEFTATSSIDPKWTDTYKITDADAVDQEIVVKVSTPNTGNASKYGGMITHMTAVVVRQDATKTISANGFDVQAPTTTTPGDDGKILFQASADGASPADHTLKYQVVKIDDDKTLADYNDEAQKTLWDDVAEATIAAGSPPAIENLLPGKYAIRLAQTKTDKPSTAIEKEVPPLGFTIKGKFFSYNSSVDPVFTLIPKGATKVNVEGIGETYYDPSTALDLTDKVTVSDGPSDPQGKHYQSFEIAAVPNGTYQLTVSKTWHLTYTLYLTVNGAEYDISSSAITAQVTAIMEAKATDDEKADTNYDNKALFLCPGELDGNGQVTDDDAAVIYTLGTFGSNDATETAKADIDGNGQVTDDDAAVIYTLGIFGESMTSYVVGSPE